MSHQDRPLVLQLSEFPASPTCLQRLAEAVEIVRCVRADILARQVALPGVIGLLPIITDPVDVALLNLLPDLRVIANYGAGVDNIDSAEATQRGIQVTNTPGVLSDAVAELTWGLILAASRRVVESDQVVRQGGFTGWTPTFQLGVELVGKTLGIFGLGQIGEAVARRAAGFGMTVVYTRRSPLPAERERALGVEFVGFEALIERSDVMSLHAPLTEETYHRFNREVLE